MSLIGGIVGGMIGFTLLGPLGALVGSVMGSRMTSRAKLRRNTNNLDHQVAFFTALFACLAKIAKADGRVSEEEVSKIESFISNKFNFSDQERNFAINIFQKAKSDRTSFDAYAKQLHQLLSSSPNSLLVFYELLFELAMADGVMHKNEEKLLKKIPSIFGFDKNVYKDLYNKYVGKISDAYEILGVTKGMTFEEIKKVYRVKRKEFHPDALISKGLPEELIEKAKEKFIEIQAAFEIIEKDVPWILDVAHNANAAKNFLQRLESLKLGNNNIMILSLMKDKNLKDFVDVFRNYVSKWIVCGMRSPRSLTGEQMKNLLKRNKNFDMSAFEYPEDAFDYSQSIYEDYESVIVTGSFEIVGPAINWLEKNK